MRDGRETGMEDFSAGQKKTCKCNSAQTESVCAGALRIQLAGDACYFGKRYKKKRRSGIRSNVEAEDIRRAVRLMYATEILTLFLFGSLRFLICLI